MKTLVIALEVALAWMICALIAVVIQYGIAVAIHDTLRLITHLFS